MSADLTYRAVGVAGRKVRDNLRIVFAAASELQREQGAEWYADAFAVADELASVAGVDHDNMAAAISHLSPQCRWAENVAAADVLARTGERAPYGYVSSFERAKRALWHWSPLDTFGPRAHKTRNFAQNLAGNLECVTVDSWAARAAGVDYRHIQNRTGAYDRIAGEYASVAAEFGIKPAVFQATVWCAIRGTGE